MSGAIISDCGKYRYRLERAIAKPFISEVDGIFHDKTVAFFGVNPSKADATINDQTAKKWIGFCERWGARRFIAGNIFAFRATDVRDLATAHDPIGPDNAAHIYQIIADADILFPCWGSNTKVPRALRGEFQTMMLRLVESGKPIFTFGLTKSGDPIHPQMLGYDTPLVERRTT
jgi:hypothetical protein